MLTFDIPEDLAREALMYTDTHDEAERYVLDAVDEIELQWPDSVVSGSMPGIKCSHPEREGSN